MNLQTTTKNQRSLEDQLYIAGWIFLLVGSIGSFLYLHIIVPRLQGYTCVVYRLFGIYCPGCGGTRAVRFLLQGHVLKSLYYHPIVVYTAIFGSWFMISQTIQRLSKGKIAIGMRYRDIYLWIALGLVLANCLIKNLVLAMTGYAMM